MLTTFDVLLSRIELLSSVLQTDALPLSYRSEGEAVAGAAASFCSFHVPSQYGQILQLPIHTCLGRSGPGRMTI